LLSSLADWSSEISKIATGSDYLSKLLKWVQDNYDASKAGQLPWDQGGSSNLQTFTEFFRKYFIAGADSSLPKFDNISFRVGNMIISKKKTPQLFNELVNYMKQTAAAFCKGPYAQFANEMFSTGGNKSISGFEALILHVLETKVLASKAQIKPGSQADMAAQFKKILNGVLPPGPSGGDGSIEAGWSIFTSIPTATSVTTSKGTEKTTSMLADLMSNPDNGPDLPEDVMAYIEQDFGLFAQVNYERTQAAGSSKPSTDSQDILGGWIQQNQGTQQSAQGVQTATSQAQTITSSELNVDFNTGQKIVGTDNDQENTITNNEKTN